MLTPRSTGLSVGRAVWQGKGGRGVQASRESDPHLFVSRWHSELNTAATGVPPGDSRQSPSPCTESNVLFHHMVPPLCDTSACCPTTMFSTLTSKCTAHRDGQGTCSSVTSENRTAHISSEVPQHQRDYVPPNCALCGQADQSRVTKEVLGATQCVK